MAFAEKFDYLKTARHFLSNLFTNLHPDNILADIRVASVNDITSEFLDQYGIEALIWDVDGTLMEYYGRGVDDSVKDAFEELTKKKTTDQGKVSQEVRHVILSNSNEERFQELGRIFPEIPVLRMYESDFSIVKRKIYQHKETFTLEPMEDKSSYVSEEDIKQRNMQENCGTNKDSTASKTRRLKDSVTYNLSLQQELSQQQKRSRDNYLGVLKEHYTLIKKPDTRLVEYAMEVLGVSVPENVAIIGDRAFTDITDGNQAGVWTIYISPPLHPETDPLLIRMFARPIEALFVKMYNLMDKSQ